MPYAEIASIKGVRNDVGPERFAAGDMARANNIDIDETGKGFRRRGTALVFAGAAHSGWSDGSQAFFVQGGFIHRMTPDGVKTSITAVAGKRVRFLDINGRVFWSDGQATGCIKDGVNSSWGIVPPSKVAVSITGGGKMKGGTYSAVMTYVDSDGVESGASLAGTVVGIETTSKSGLNINSLSVSADPRVRTKKVYATSGEVMVEVAQIPNSATSVACSQIPGNALTLRTRFMGPPPAGQVLGYYNGRAYVGFGQFLMYSQPFEYELFDPRDFVPLDSDVQTFAAVRDGIFVGTKNKTVFLEGESPEKFTVKPVSPYGTVLGTELPIASTYFNTEKESDNSASGSTSMLWMSQRGAVLGSDGGQFRDLTAARYIPPKATVGAALLKLRDNTTPQYLVSLVT